MLSRVCEDARKKKKEKKKKEKEKNRDHHLKMYFGNFLAESTEHIAQVTGSKPLAMSGANPACGCLLLAQPVVRPRPLNQVARN